MSYRCILKKASYNLGLITFIILFVTIYTNFFGSVNTLIGVATVTGLLMFKNIDLQIHMKQIPFVMIGGFVLIGISTHLSLWNPLLGFFIHLLVIFSIVFITSERFELKTYIPFVLCYVFVQGNPIKSDELLIRLLALAISGIIMTAVYYIFIGKKSISSKRIGDIFRCIDFKSLRFEYAVKLAISLALVMFISEIFNIQKGMWISISVMSLTQTEFEISKYRMKYRILSTFIGSAIFIIVFHVILPQQYNTFMVLLLSYIYTFISNYPLQMIFITINSLGAAEVILDTDIAILTRISFVILGALLVFLIHHINVVPSLKHWLYSKQLRNRSSNECD